MRSPKPSAGAGTGEDGFVIVPVLWIMMLLAGLAGIVSVYLSNTAVALALNDTRLKSEAIVTAGLELTTYRLLSASTQKRPQSGSFSFSLDQAVASVRFSADSNRINLNLAPKEVLANLFQVLGAQPKDADQYADRIIAWRSLPPQDALDSENSLYRVAGLPYLPRGAPFPNVQELWLVLGLPSALVERAMSYVTVFGSQPEINVFEAAPEVVAAIPGMTPAGLARFLKERDALSRDRTSITEYFGPKADVAASLGSDVIRIRTDIAFNNGSRSGAEAVILLNGGSEPYKILSWQDDADSFARTEPRWRRGE